MTSGFPHKGPVTRKMLPFDDFSMINNAHNSWHEQSVDFDLTAVNINQVYILWIRELFHFIKCLNDSCHMVTSR